MYYPIWADPTFLIFIVPAMLLGLSPKRRSRVASSNIRRCPPCAICRGAGCPPESWYNGLSGVSIEETQGFLSDHYDPRSQTPSPVVGRARSRLRGRGRRGRPPKQVRGCNTPRVTCPCTAHRSGGRLSSFGSCWPAHHYGASCSKP